LAHLYTENQQFAEAENTIGTYMEMRVRPNDSFQNLQGFWSAVEIWRRPSGPPCWPRKPGGFDEFTDDRINDILVRLGKLDDGISYSRFLPIATRSPLFPASWPFFMVTRRLGHMSDLGGGLREARQP